MLKFNRHKRYEKKYGDYPCNVFLHNALRFIEQGKYDIAYDEICWALLKAGDELIEHEKEKFVIQEGDNNAI